MKRVLFAAALSVPSWAGASTKLAVAPSVTPGPLAAARAYAPAAMLALPAAMPGLAAQVALAVPAPQPGRPSATAVLRQAASLSGTLLGGRQVWDLARSAVRGAEEPVWTGTPAAAPASGLKPASSELAAPKPPAVEQGRWRQMKASTKQDFKALFSAVRRLRGSLVLPKSGAAIKTNLQAVGRFFSEVRRLGWKVIGAVVLYYLVRDTILYVLIPYLVLNGVFR